jgi:hypothetical protein
MTRRFENDEERKAYYRNAMIKSRAKKLQSVEQVKTIEQKTPKYQFDNIDEIFSFWKVKMLEDSSIKSKMINIITSFSELEPYPEIFEEAEEIFEEAEEIFEDDNKLVEPINLYKSSNIIPIEAVFLEEQILKKGKMDIKYNRRELNDEFVLFLKKKWMCKRKLETLLKKISKIDIKFQKSKTVDGLIYTFDFAHIYTILLSKRFIRHI